ncbi:MAG: EamA family transporter [Hormoscilla sp. GM7CHS1pb]|nr:EamA family transporter [Hormoscilla sp. GM7CHS1pb]
MFDSDRRASRYTFLFFCQLLLLDRRSSQSLWAWSLSQITVAISTVLVSLKPLFTCLFAWLIWGQRFDNKFLIGMVIAIGGAGAIGLDDLLIDTGNFKGDIAVLRIC